MGGHDAYKIPDPSIYKVEDVPQLAEVKKALGRMGLCDPWLRNEAWRYDVKNFGTHGQRFRTFMFRGFLWGLGAAVITVAIENGLKASHGGDHGHGHHD